MAQTLVNREPARLTMLGRTRNSHHAIDPSDPRIVTITSQYNSKLHKDNQNRQSFIIHKDPSQLSFPSLAVDFVKPAWLIPSAVEASTGGPFMDDSAEFAYSMPVTAFIEQATTPDSIDAKIGTFHHEVYEDRIKPIDDPWRLFLCNALVKHSAIKHAFSGRNGYPSMSPDHERYFNSFLSTFDCHLGHYLHAGEPGVPAETGYKPTDRCQEILIRREQNLTRLAFTAWPRLLDFCIDINEEALNSSEALAPNIGSAFQNCGTQSPAEWLQGQVISKLKCEWIDLNIPREAFSEDNPRALECRLFEWDKDMRIHELQVWLEKLIQLEEGQDNEGMSNGSASHSMGANGLGNDGDVEMGGGLSEQRQGLGENVNFGSGWIGNPLSDLANLPVNDGGFGEDENGHAIDPGRFQTPETGHGSFDLGVFNLHGGENL